MSGFEKPFPEDFDFTNFDFLKAIDDCINAPEWEGYAIPDPSKVRRFWFAVSELAKLIETSPDVEQVLTEPAPFHQDCGGQIVIYCSGNRFAFAVFKNREVIEKVSRFLGLIDSISITAEKTNQGEPCLIVDWMIYDVFRKVE